MFLRRKDGRVFNLSLVREWEKIEKGQVYLWFSKDHGITLDGADAEKFLEWVKATPLDSIQKPVGI